jgi:hypothetical protein
VNETGNVCPFSPYDDLLGRKPSEFTRDVDQLDVLEVQSLVSLSLKPALLFLLIDSRFLHGIRIKDVYEAMLSGAPEFPDEVAQIALELCGRKDEPAHAIKRRDEEQERQYRLQQEWRKKNPEKKRAEPSPPFVTSSHRDGPIRPPGPDGPTREVAEGFQAAVLDTQALVGLISVRPEIAREVLLAVCIEEPTPTDLYGDDRWMGLDLGLADWRQGYPAMYWKGGFLRFLQTVPKQGLDAIVRLVNYATARWLEGGLRREPTDADREKFGFDFQIDGRKVNWVGDCNVFACA